MGHQRTFFTSDTHFGHANILEYSNRPFETIEEHDETLIDNWNSVVDRRDHVFHLGDFSIRFTTSETERYLKRLNGHIHLIFGNHDSNKTRRAKGLAWKGDRREIKVNSQKIVLCHYAMLTWNRSHHGAWHLFGHSHGNLQGPLIDEILKTRPMMDVGVDCHDYFPISFERVASIFHNRGFIPIDHHAPGIKD